MGLGVTGVALGEGVTGGMFGFGDGVTGLGLLVFVAFHVFFYFVVFCCFVVFLRFITLFICK